MEFGNVTNEEAAWNYNLTFEPKYYIEQARQTFFEETYAQRQREKETEAQRATERIEDSDIDNEVNPNSVNSEDYNLKHEKVDATSL